MADVDIQKLKKDFAQAYEDHSDAIFRFCVYQTSNREKALDLTADTFTKTWEYISAGKTKEMQNLRAFLYKVAKNLIIDDRRKKKAQSLESMMEAGFDVKDEHNENLVHENAFDSGRAMQVLQSLDEKYRDVLTLRYVNDMSVSEIAQIVGESENNVSVRISRGMEKLRTMLNT